MATKELDASNETLDAMFRRGLDIHQSLEESTDPMNSEVFQHKVKKGILLLEDATRLVSILDVFSRNETVSEVPTEHLKYFLLPVLLGDLNSKLTNHESRLDVIKIVETYYDDFLSRIKDYGIANVPSRDKSIQPKQTKDSQAQNLAKMNREREEKIRRYKESKEIEASLKQLKVSLDNPQCDEEIVRQYYLKLVRKFVFFAIDELTSFETEKEILEHMAKMRQGGAGALPPKQPESSKRPLRPIIITRDAIQKEIFGMGYKNLPVMSIEEFYDQRVRDGWFPKPQESRNNLQDRAKDPEQAQLYEEEEAAAQEKKEEEDDPEELQKKRNFDEYKDDHKRGEGNRHNRG